jgi:hypothetical protein
LQLDADCSGFIVNKPNAARSGPPPFSSLNWMPHRLDRELAEVTASLLLRHPKPEAARLIIIDELNSRLFERCLNLGRP